MLVRQDPVSTVFREINKGFSRNCYDINFLEICPNCKNTKGFTSTCGVHPIYRCKKCGCEFGEKK